jgi:hypothetical protein
MATDIKVVKTVFSVDSTDIDAAKVKYNGLTTSIEKATTALKNQSTDAKTSVADLNKSIGSVINRTNQLQAEYQKISNQASKTFDGKTLDIYKQKMQALQSEAKELGVKLTDTNKQTEKLKSGFSGIGNAIAGAFAIGSIVSFGKSVIDITSQVQKYRAVLTNTLGSQQRADMAMGMIQDTAIKTNFSVMELTDTYIKFANRGLKLTSGEMMKLADIANSTGKSIDQLTEATLDAFTGENERLKEFGITAKKTGETTQYTFKGVTTEVKNTQEAIKGYLLGLGDLEGVSGSTVAISEQLGGQISNLGDKWDKFLIKLGEGNSGALNTSIKLLGNMVDVLDKIFKSQQNFVDEIAIEKSKDILKEVEAEYERALKLHANRSKTKKEILQEEFDNETKTRSAILEAQKQDLAALEKSQKPKSYQHTQAYKDLENDIIIQKASIKYTELFLQTLSDELKKRLEADTVVIKAETEKQRQIRIKALQALVPDALNLLKHEEEIAKQKALNAGGTALDVLKIEDKFNSKRIDIYKKYSDILNTKQKQDEESTLVNVVTIGKKIEKQTKDDLAARLKANEEWSKKVNDLHLKDEKDLVESLNRKASIEQDTIGIERAKTLIKLYESTNLTIEQKLDERKKIEEVFEKQSLEATIKADEERLQLLTLNREDYIALERKIAEEKVKVNKDANDKIVEDDKKKQEERKEIAKQSIDLLKQGINAVYQYKSQVNEQELTDLKDKEEREMKQAGDNQAKKDAIAKKYQLEEAKVRKKQFEQNKQIALINIAINTAEGISDAWTKTATAPFMVPLVIASGAIQAALVSSQPTPKFAKGVIDLQGKGTGTSDEIHAMLSKGESVMTAEETSRFKPLLQSIRRKELSPELANMMLSGQKMSNINLDTSHLAKELRSMPKNHISLDKDGFKTFIYSEHLKQEKLNNRYGV